jgi:hypothetical protein
VAAFRAALEELTRERMPLAWAMSTGNQGLALLRLAERTSDTGMARHARDRIADAAAAMREGGHAHYAEFFVRQLVAAEAVLERLLLGGAAG